MSLTERDAQKTRVFYFLLCLGGFLLILLPVGIANLILGYFFGDSPCVLCWGEREEMIFIGVMALFMVRYGWKPKYWATLMIMSACGLWMSFRHFSLHAGDDIGQGFGLSVFGIHTYLWAEIVFWCCVLIFGIVMFFAPRVEAMGEEAQAQTVRPMTPFTKVAFAVVAFIIASNSFQAFVTSGPPPYWGQSNPIRLSWNPKFNQWSFESYHTFYNSFSFLGATDVDTPNLASSPDKALGIKWNHDAQDAPIPIQGMLKVVKSVPVEGVNVPLDTVAMIDGHSMVASKHSFWQLNAEDKVDDSAAIDPWFDTNILDLVAIVPYGKDGFLLVGMNKALIGVRWDPNGNEVANWPNFTAGLKSVEVLPDVVRKRIGTFRAKHQYIHGAASDGKYLFLSTVPDNRSKHFIISQVMLKDWMLSAEFTPTANLKPGRNLDDLYVTGMTYFDGNLYAVSKNFNLLIEINPQTQAITNAWGLPAELTDIRGLEMTDKTITILDKNHLVTLDR